MASFLQTQTKLKKGELKAMAKSVEERCNKIVGVKEGSDYFTTIKRTKVGDETTYAFGAHLTLPAKLKNTGDADLDKVCLLWAKRMVSADNAGLPGQISDGKITVDEAADIIMSYNGEEFLTRLNEVKERTAAEPSDPFVTAALSVISATLRSKTKDDKIKTAKIPVPAADNPPLDKNGEINFRAWAKILQAANYPWYTQAYEAAKKKSEKFD